jgi:hypothetical protein
MSKWIKVSEQLPPPRKGQDTAKGLSVAVLIWNPSNRSDRMHVPYVCACYDYETGNWWSQNILKLKPAEIPTHWQYLPEPPVVN